MKFKKFIDEREKRHLFDFPPKFEEGDIVKINNKNVWLNEHPYEQNLAKIYDINGDPHEQGENKNLLKIIIDFLLIQMVIIY